MVTKAKKALLASLAAFLCVMLTVFGLSMSVSLSETAKAADDTATELTDYVVVGGIKGFEDKKFASFEEAYNAIKPIIGTLGLGQESASATDFDAIFTDVVNGNAKLTYTIKGNVVYDETSLDHLLTMGRKASHYGNDRHLIKFAFVGVTADKKDTLTVNSNITLPYEWWGEKVTTSISFENLTITGSAPNGLYTYQSYFEGIDFTVNNCTLKGIKIYNCANVGGTYTITNSTLDGTGAAANAYAIHLQGNETAPLAINISGNTISGYDRGVNIDQATANATISNNTISVKDAKRSCIQLSSLAETTIADNELNLTGGNAITLHSNLAEGSKITVKANTIAGEGYLIYDDTKKAIDLTYGENTVAATVDMTKGVYGGTTKDLSDDVYNEVHHVLAEVNGVKFATLAEAIAAAKDGETVKLLADATEDVVVDKNITLDLGGKTLTSTNSGKATVSIQNGATTTVKNGSIVGSTSYYTIEIKKGSNATATFEDLTATAGNTGSSMIDNWGTLTITSGTYTGGLNVVKSEEGSVLTINGGEFTRTSAPSFGITGTILVYGTTTITGGKFIDKTSSTNARVVVTGVVEGYTAITRITGGSFTNTNGAIFHYIGKATYDNFEVSGGTFSKSIPYYYFAENKVLSKNSSGSYGVRDGKYVAGVGTTGYETLEAAIKATKKGTIELLDNINGNFEIVSTKKIKIDLNGYTINGGTGTAKAAITNKGTLTIKDSSAAKTGTIKRDDNGVENETSYYVIRNLGTMTIEQANVVNNSGYRKTNPSGSMVGSSLICNGDGDNNEEANLTIKGGKLTQLNFIAIKNGSNGTLVVNGGEITSNHSAVQNWYNATIKGGKITGQIWTDAWEESSIGKTVIDGTVEFTGEIVMDITGSIKPELTINGGNLSVTNWRVTTACAELGGKPAVQGGTFTNAVPVEYCAEGFIPTKNTDGTFGVKVGTYVAKIGEAGYETLAEAIAAAESGDTITLLADITNTDYTVENAINIALPAGVTLDGNNHTLSGNVKITVASAGGVTIKNVKFKDIHNAAVVSDAYKTKYGFSDDKVGTLSAIYASNLNGSLTVTGCEFENVDWDAMQITPATGAEVVIKNNIFKVSESETVKEQLRHVHVEMAYGGGVDYEGTDIVLTVTDNQFIAETKEASLGVWWVGKDSTLDLTGNYYADPDSASITLSDKSFNRENRVDLIYPARSTADVDEDNLTATVMLIKDAFNSATYSTLAEAIAAAKDGETVKLLANVAEFEGAEVTKNLTFDFGDYTITGKTGATVLHVKNAKVTLNGKTGGIDGGAGGDNIAVRADTGAEVIINGGVYTVGADAKGLGNSTVYVTDNGKVIINGGTFSSKAAYNGKYYVLNVQNSAKGTFEVKGGTFKDFDPLSGDDNLGGNFAPEGYGANYDKNGNFTIVAGVVAQVKDANGKSVKAYATLQEALNAAPRKAIVMLLADTRENVTIATMLITLDLNGHTINGGTVNGKPAVTVTARVTIKDSSAAQTGTIMREDTAENSGVSSYYVIDVQGDGWLTFEGGNVINHSGVVGVRGASLVRVGDDSVAEYPGLNIKGGTFTQDNFVAIKVDRGDLFLNGGTLNSANSYAIEDWHRATVKGGTVNGAVAAWAYSGGLNSTLEISGGTINGDVTSVNYGNATDKKATVSVTGGTINGKLDTRSYDPATGDLTSINDAAKATIGVSGGTFKENPSKYLVEESAITENADGTFGVKKAYLARVGNTSYYTMDEAFKAQTTSGEAIVLLRDYTTGSTFNSGTKHRVVDLNRHTWTYTGTDMNSAAFEINNPNATLTVKNGTIISSTIVGLIPSAMGGTIKYDNAGLVFDGVTMTSNGSSGIETNGNNTNDSVTLKNSTLNVPNGFGIYFPSSGTLTIDNSTINAKTMGVQVCSGELNINAGSAITVSGDAVPKAENDGAIQDGAAISIVNRTGYKGLSNIVITGGTFTAKAGNDAIKAYDWVNKVESTFTKADLVAVSGGTFSSEVKKDYLADRFVVNKNTTNGTYGVTAGSGFAGACVVVTESLAMKVVVSTASKYVVVTYKGLDGIAKTVRFDKFTDIRIDNKDYKYCLFDQIMPQMIDVKFSFELYGENDVMLDRKANYSVVDYLARIIASEKDSAAFRNVAASLIEYANRAKVVKGLTTTVAPTFVDKAGNAVELDYNAFVGKNKIPAKDTLGEISEGNAQVIYKAKVVFDDAYTLKFYTNAGDGKYTYTLSKNGSTEEEEGITFDKNGEFTINVLAQDITTQYVIKVYGEDKTQPIQTVTYGVSTYCIRMQETKTPQGELYVASYYYGVAVQQYGAANTASVQV